VTTDFRPRPPEIVISENKTLSGPIKDLFEKIVSDAGGRVEWRVRPFKRSLMEAKQSNIPDCIVRMSFTEKRAKFLLPILFGYQRKNVYFAVKKGDEALIKTYDDLYKFKVYVKSGSNYFTKFDNDKKIKRKGVLDDASLARMFVAGRIQVMLVIDMESFMVEYNKAIDEMTVVNELSFAKFAYHQNRARYMTLSRNSVHAKNPSDPNDFYQRVLKSTHTNRGCVVDGDHYKYDATRDSVLSAYKKHDLTEMSPVSFDCNAYFN